MNYINIPKDLTKVKSKFAGGLSIKQLGLVALGGAVGIPLFFITRGLIGNGPALMMLFIGAAPFAFLAIFSKDDITGWGWIKNIFRHSTRTHKRMYKTKNFYTFVDKGSKEGEGVTRDQTRKTKAGG